LLATVDEPGRSLQVNSVRLVVDLLADPIQLTHFS